jgi:hypothetical protein
MQPSTVISYVSFVHDSIPLKFLCNEKFSLAAFLFIFLVKNELFSTQSVAILDGAEILDGHKSAPSYHPHSTILPLRSKVLPYKHASRATSTRKHAATNYLFWVCLAKFVVAMSFAELMGLASVSPGQLQNVGEVNATLRHPIL